MCQTPRRSIRRLNTSTSFRSARLQLRSCSSTSTPSTPLEHGHLRSPSPLLNEDRFIPNRSRVDTPRARKALLEESYEQRDDVDNDNEYKRQLRRTLFGDDFIASSSSKSLLGLGDHYNAASTMKDKIRTIDPANVDVLRSTLKSDVALPAFPRKVDHKKVFLLNASGVDPRDDLHVLSVGPRFALGIWDIVVFDEWGRYSHEPGPQIPHLPLPHIGSVSAVQWRYKGQNTATTSNNNYVLAVGGQATVEVYDVANKSLMARLMDHMDPVTSLEWLHSDGMGNDLELLASSSVGIRRYDLRLRMPEVFTYNTKLAAFQDAPAAKMQIQPGTEYLLAAAMPTNNMVAFWDLRYSRVPMNSLEHTDVKGLEFSPLHRNTLATGGHDGIRFWNVQSGALRSAAETKDPVTTLTWSPHQHELMAGFGDYMGVWAVSPCSNKVHQLEQWTEPDAGQVIAIERMEDGPETRVLTLHGDDGFLVCWKPFAPKRKQSQKHGTQGMVLACSPVLR